MDTQKEIIRMRNHFSYIFEQMWGILLVFGAMLFSSDESFKLAMEFFAKGDIIQGLMALGGLFLLLIIIMALYINRWYKTSITVKDGTFTIERRTLNRRINAIAVQNISNINLEQNLFEMVMGTYKLKLDTNSMSTADKTDVQIVLKKEDAYAVKNLVMAMMKEIQREQGLLEEDAEDNSSTVDMMEDREENSYDIIYNMKEILSNCLVNTSIILVLVSLALFVAAIVGAVGMIKSGKGMAAIVSSTILQLFLAGSIFTALVKNWLNDFNFRAKRDKDKIYISCGLIKRKKYAVPVDKINAVCLTSSFLGRIFKRAYVKVINIGGEGEEVNGMKILLAAPYDVLKKRMAILLPEFAFPELEEIKRPPKRYFVKKIIQVIIVVGAIAIGMVLGFKMQNALSNQVMLYIFLGALLLAAFCSFFVFLSYRAAGLAVKPEYLVISRGMFIRTIQFITYDKIQYIHFQSGPLERKMNLQFGYVSILASAASRIQTMGTFETERFSDLEVKLKETY